MRTISIFQPEPIIRNQQQAINHHLKTEFFRTQESTSPIGDIQISIQHDIDGKNLSVIIITPNLTLKTIEDNLNNYQFYKDLCGDELTMKSYASGNPWSDEYIAHRLKSYHQSHAYGNAYNAGFIIYNRDNEPVGHLGLDPEDEIRTKLYFTDKIKVNLESVVDIGYIIKREHWNKGIASEAANAVVRYYLKMLIDLGFKNNQLPFTTLEATAKPENIASKKILETIWPFAEIHYKYNAQRFLFHIDITKLNVKQQFIYTHGISETEDRPIPTTASNDFTCGRQTL